MSEYSSQTVAQLRELLKSRGLAPQGLKNELIERLTKDDQEKENAGEGAQQEQQEQQEQGPEEEVKGEQTEEKHSEKQNGSETNAEGGAAVAAAPVEEETPQQEKKDYKQEAIELLNKKLHRAKKFGQDQQQVDSLQKLLVRIEKFGLDKSMPIAQEVGMVPPKAEGSGNARPKNNNKSGKKFKKSARKSHRRN